MLTIAEETLARQAIERVTQNAWIEVGAIHGRNLADFFYPTQAIARRQADDVFAQDLVPDGEWVATRPAAPESLSRHEFRDPVNKQIAHLTKSTNPKKDWDFSIVATALQPALEHFLQMVPLASLGERWREQLATKSGPRWATAQRVLQVRHTDNSAWSRPA
ncbi:MAG TPA: hypothetical protein VEC57_07850 [Candidatus Limnocylindrales bacterium]|nr:hypothetical protein [Candidatus Limnocylindrales bacterium]